MESRLKQNPPGDLSQADIAAVVERDTKGQMNVAARFAANDTKVAFELIAVALYRAMRRRGLPHLKALKSTEELIFITDFKVVLK